MTIPLPGALSQFSQSALKQITALAGIQEISPNVQGTVQSNITSAATKAITEQPGNLFADVPGFVSGANQSFLDSIATPPSLTLNNQTQALNSLFGTDQIAGGAVDDFLKQNVRLQDIIPAQQLFQLTASLGSIAMYADPMQAFTQVTATSRNLSNLCKQAVATIGKIEDDIAQLLDIQPLMNYAQMALMDTAHFVEALAKATASSSLFTALTGTFSVRGQFDPATLHAFCASLDDLVNLLMFADSKPLKFDLLRQDLVSLIQTLRVLLRSILDAFGNAHLFVDAYIGSASKGKLFNSVQAKVVVQGAVEIAKIIKQIQALKSTNADSKSKLQAAWAIASAVQAVKAFICEIQPAVAIQDPLGEFAPLSAGYSVLTSSLKGNDPNGLFNELEAVVDQFLSTIQTAVTQNNSAALIAVAGTMTGILSGLEVSLLAISSAADAFQTLFQAQTAIDPARIVGTADLFSDAGLDQAVAITRSSSFDAITSISLTDATSTGQLAASLNAQIATMPEGNEKDQMILLYSKVYSQHRSTLLSMDFQQRENVQSLLAVEQANAQRQLVNKSTKTFSGIPSNQFDNVLLQ